MVKAKRHFGYRCSHCSLARGLVSLPDLKVSDVAHEEMIGAECLCIVPNAKAGRRLKNKHSARAVPIHRQLIEVGFLDFVKEQVQGEAGWLFPEVAPGTTGASSFSKWFGRYVDANGLTDPAKVFHSFRHNFTDALRLAAVSGDVSRALVGHSQEGVHGRYGVKKMAARYRHRLAERLRASLTQDWICRICSPPNVERGRRAA